MKDIETLRNRLTEEITKQWKSVCENPKTQVAVIYDEENDDIYTLQDVANGNTRTQREQERKDWRVCTLCETGNDIIDEYKDGYGDEWVDAYVDDQHDEIDFIVDEFIEKLKS